MIPLTGHTAEEVLNDEPSIAAEGYYQIKLVSYKPHEYNGITKHQLKWQIIGAPTNLLDERGKYLFTFWAENSEVFVKQVLKTGVACGMYSEHQVQGWFKNGAMPDPDFESWLGALCVCKVTHSEFKGKTYANIGFDFFPLEHSVVEEAGILFDGDHIDATQDTTAAEDSKYF